MMLMFFLNFVFLGIPLEPDKEQTASVSRRIVISSSGEVNGKSCSEVIVLAARNESVFCNVAVRLEGVLSKIEFNSDHSEGDFSRYLHELEFELDKLADGSRGVDEESGSWISFTAFHGERIDWTYSIRSRDIADVKSGQNIIKVFETILRRKGLLLMLSPYLFSIYAPEDRPRGFEPSIGR